MSGFVGTAVEVVSELIGAISLGGVTFFGFEIPDKLKWGGKQKIEIHKLPGGDRVFSVMGADDNAISWSGYFSGALASLRARQVDTMRTAGQPVTLLWPGFTRNVIIEEFTCSSERGGFLLPYTVSCQVVPDPSNSLPSLLDQVSQDFTAATGITIPDPTAAFETAMNVVAAAEVLVPAGISIISIGSATTTALTIATNTANATIAEELAINEAAAAPMINSVNVLGSTTAVPASNNLLGALSWTQTEAGLVAMQGYMARITVNLANAGG